MVCAEVPWPADKRSAIDIFHRIKAFHKNGIGVHLHCVSAADTPPYELCAFCSSIHLYPPKKLGTNLFSRKDVPECIESRINESLIATLSRDQHPILFEGFVTVGYLQYIDLQNRKICVRIQHDEGRYQLNLAKNTRNPLKWFFFKKEGSLLKKYYKMLPKSLFYAFACKKDQFFFESSGFENTNFLPAFTGWQKINSRAGKGSFCLFHGNLSQPENAKAAFWLLRNVFNKIKIPFVIAGKDPSVRLQKAAHVFKHTCIVANPPEEELNDLVGKAHINILPCFNKSKNGVSFKLLHALFEGRHCVVTPTMAESPELQKICHIGKDADSIAGIIHHLYHQPFQEQEVHLRYELLGSTYNNQKNIEPIINYLW